MSDTLLKKQETISKTVQGYDARIVKPSPTKEEVEARLRSTSESISTRLDIIQDEISSTGESIKKAIAENPAIAIGLSLAAGVLVGMIAGGRRKETDHVSRSVIAGLAAAIEEALDEGADPDEAARIALADIEPYLKPPTTTTKGGAFSTIARTAARAGFAVLLRKGISSFIGPEDPGID